MAQWLALPFDVGAPVDAAEPGAAAVLLIGVSTLIH
jgi:hypothetical protein